MDIIDTSLMMLLSGGGGSARADVPKIIKAWRILGTDYFVALRTAKMPSNSSVTRTEYERYVYQDSATPDARRSYYNFRAESNTSAGLTFGNIIGDEAKEPIISLGSAIGYTYGLKKYDDGYIGNEYYGRYADEPCGEWSLSFEVGVPVARAKIPVSFNQLNRVNYRNVFESSGYVPDRFGTYTQGGYKETAEIMSTVESDLEFKFCVTPPDVPVPNRSYSFNGILFYKASVNIPEWYNGFERAVSTAYAMQGKRNFDEISISPEIYSAE